METIKKMNKNKIIGILLVVMIILLVALILTLCGRGSSGTRSIAGSYEIESIEGGDNTLSDDDLNTMKAMDLTITLDVQDDGTAVMDMFGEETNISYDLDSGTMDIDGREASFKLDGNKLTIKQDGSEMIFKK